MTTWEYIYIEIYIYPQMSWPDFVDRPCQSPHLPDPFRPPWALRLDDEDSTVET